MKRNDKIRYIACRQKRNWFRKGQRLRREKFCTFTRFSISSISFVTSTGVGSRSCVSTCSKFTAVVCWSSTYFDFCTVRINGNIPTKPHEYEYQKYVSDIINIGVLSAVVQNLKKLMFKLGILHVGKRENGSKRENAREETNFPTFAGLSISSISFVTSTGVGSRSCVSTCSKFTAVVLRSSAYLDFCKKNNGNLPATPIKFWPVHGTKH